MADQEKRIHQLNEVGDKSGLYFVLDDVSLPEAVKFDADNIIDKAYTDTLYVKLSGDETVNGVKTWVNQQILQNGADVTGGNISIQSGGKLSVNAAIGSNVVRIYAQKDALKMQYDDTTDGYTEILYGTSAQNKWSCGVFASTFATGTQQNAYYIYQYNDKAGASVNTIRFMIDNAGNVGIGTTSPTLKFNVVGNSYFNGSVGIGTSTMTTVFNVTGNTYFNGNVGIGIETANNTLHVYKYTGIAGSQVYLQGRKGGYGAGIEMLSELSDTTTVKSMAKVVSDGDSSWNSTASTQNARLTFHVSFEGTMTERMRIDPSGNVGIGTTSPRNLFTCSVSAALTSLPALGSMIGGTASFVAGNAYGLACYNLNSGTSVLQSQRADGTNTAYAIALNPSGGKVGIGTTSPQKLLHLYENSSGGTAFASAQMIIENDASAFLNFLGGTTGVCGIMFGDSDFAYSGYLRYSNNDDSLQIYTAGTSKMTIDSNGYVGIGVSPSYTLHVSDSIDNYVTRLYNTSTGTSASGLYIDVTGTGGISNYIMQLRGNGTYMFYVRTDGYISFSATWYSTHTTASSANIYSNSSGIILRSTSSEKIKQNIKYKIDPELIFKLKPCEFESKVDENKNMLGFIAEQVNEIDQRFATGQEEKDGFLGLQINAILAATVAGLQDVNNRLKKLEKRKTK